MPNLKWKSPEVEKLLVLAVRDSTSIRQVLQKLGLAPVGGNYQTVKTHIARLQLDTSHHTGQLWSRDLYEVPHSSRGTAAWKRYLIGTRGHKCERCKNEAWLGAPIPLELEHIDGNRTNNSEHNCLLLCPNCHALTPTYRRRKSSLSR